MPLRSIAFLKRRTATWIGSPWRSWMRTLIIALSQIKTWASCPSLTTGGGQAQQVGTFPVLPVSRRQTLVVLLPPNPRRLRLEFDGFIKGTGKLRRQRDESQRLDDAG